VWIWAKFSLSSSIIYSIFHANSCLFNFWHGDYATFIYTLWALLILKYVLYYFLVSYFYFTSIFRTSLRVIWWGFRMSYIILASYYICQYTRLPILWSHYGTSFSVFYSAEVSFQALRIKILCTVIYF
jgi:hypothetical protein